MIILVALSTGCQLKSTASSHQPAVENSQMPPDKTAKTQNLLEIAEKAIANDQLLFPQSGSAHSTLLSVLKIDPGNQGARRGLEKIVERYIQLSVAAIDRKQFHKAQSMIDRAKLVEAKHPSIKPTQKQLDLVSSAIIKIIEIQNQGIDKTTTNKISAFAKNTGKNCRYLIRAKNDEQGRLIYNTLKSHSHGAKLKAQISIRLPAQIEQQCFTH